MATKKPASTYNQTWYGDNRDKVSANRRKRRAEDPKAARDAAERAREWRANRAAGARVEREIYKELDGKRVRVYSTGQVADRLGITASALKKWDANDLLPQVLFEGSHRYYTLAQVREIEKTAKKLRKQGIN